LLAHREDTLTLRALRMALQRRRPVPGRVQRRVVLGPVSNLSERAAWKLFQPYLDRVNAAVKLPPKSGMTLIQFVQEWRSSVAVNLKGGTTRAAESNLRAHIIPKSEGCCSQSEWLHSGREPM